MSKNRPTIPKERIVQIYKDMQSWRGHYFKDSPFEKVSGIVNAAKFWEWLAEEIPEVKIRYDRYLEKVDTRIAFVLRLDPHVILNVSKQKFESARGRLSFSNFVLAHEFAHVALEHSETSTAPMPFSLHEEDGQFKASVDDVIELEAHYGAIFLQVGDQIFEKDLNTRQLAKYSATDYYRLNQLHKICQDEEIQKLFRESKRIKRVIL